MLTPSLLEVCGTRRAQHSAAQPATSQPTHSSRSTCIWCRTDARTFGAPALVGLEKADGQRPGRRTMHAPCRLRHARQATSMDRPIGPPHSRRCCCAAPTHLAAARERRVLGHGAALHAHLLRIDGVDGWHQPHQLKLRRGVDESLRPVSPDGIRAVAHSVPPSPPVGRSGSREGVKKVCLCPDLSFIQAKQGKVGSNKGGLQEKKKNQI